MDVISYVQAKTLEKDRLNLEKTQRSVLRHFEHGDPIVPKFEEKIATYCDRYNITRGEVLASILTDRVAATRFAKNASRQGTAEKAQFEYLREVRGIDVKRLKKSGPNCIRLHKGELHTGLPKMTTATKSLDGKYKNDYIFFKWTDGEGGHQDYAGFDAIRFLDQAKKYVDTHDDNVRFILILDGPYFTRHWNVFASYRSERILIETSDTYRKPGRRPLVVNVTGRKTYRVKTV